MTEKCVIVRKIEFDAAHRIMDHESKCKYLHGHRYVLEVAFSAPELDDLGRVIDFAYIKEKLKTWIDDNFDHTAILSTKDTELGRGITRITRQEIYYMPCNPTAENIALHLKNEILPSLFASKPIKVEWVKLFETPNCYAQI